MSVLKSLLLKILPLREKTFNSFVQQRESNQSETLLRVLNTFKESTMRNLLISQFNMGKDVQRIVFMGVSAHDNLDRAAIAMATRRFLLENAAGRDVIQVADTQYFDALPDLLNLIRPSDLLILIGGGNLGNQYVLEENIHRSVILNFPKNKIVIFPQMGCFTDDEVGNAELQKSRAIYSLHGNLTVFAREKKSLDLMKSWFPQCRVEMAPDVFLRFKQFFPTVRANALCCFQSDVEKSLKIEDEMKIRCALLKHLHIMQTNTCANHLISINEQTMAVLDKLQEFCQARIVVTDRLHAMIFSAVTGTPCVALGNYNHKLSSFHDTWLKGRCDYILFAKDATEAVDCIERLLQQPIPTSVPDFTQDFAPLANLLK